MFVAVRVDADRRDEDQVLVHMNAVDLDRQQIKSIEPAFHPRLHARSRQRDETAGRRRLRQPGPLGRRNVSLGQANRTFEPARRDVDQHLVHRPFAEQIFVDGVFPARQNLLLAVEPANARALDLDLAAVEADLASRPPPAMRLAPFAPLVTLAASPRA